MKKLFNKIQTIITNREHAVLCTIIETKGSTPLKAGAKMIVWDNGKIFGTIGGGELEKNVISYTNEFIEKESKPDILEYNLVKDLGMCCGGTVKVYIEQIALPYQLYIFGAGHVGSALAKQAALLDFEITIIDDRKEMFDKLEVPRVCHLNKNPVESITSLKWDKYTYAVIMTYNHPMDREILANCIKQPAGYIGMIGSKRKAAVTKKLFKQQGIATDEMMDNIDVPIGVDINAETPEEIAVSIIARLIQEKNKVKPKSNKIEKLTIEEESCLKEIINITQKE